MGMYTTTARIPLHCILFCIINTKSPRFNPSGSGNINPAELGTILGKLGDPANDAEIAQMIELADISKNGGVNFGDFETIMLD